IITFSPSTWPTSLRPRRNARKRSVIASGDLGSRSPITGIAACCARAASGHRAAAPTSVMNSRRLIVAPRGQNHAPHRLTAVRVLERDERGANCDQLFWAGNVGFESHDRGQNRKSSVSANAFPVLPPKADLRSARQRVYLSIGFATRALVGPQHGATLGADHLVWGGPQRNSHAPHADRQTRARAGGLPEILAVSVVYTFRKSLLLPKPRDVTYRQRKCLSVLACDAFGADLNRSESEGGAPWLQAADGEGAMEGGVRTPCQPGR